MSEDRSIIPSPTDKPVLLGVRAGDLVVVWDDHQVVGNMSQDWWIAQVVFVEGSGRNPKAPSLFQVACVDTGVIRWVNADCVQQVMLPFELPEDFLSDDRK